MRKLISTFTLNPNSIFSMMLISYQSVGCIQLQSAVSGLNRGLAATEDDLRKADAIAKDIEGVAGQVDLSIDIDKLQGRWKLIYSSAFSSRTLGGNRPGPPTGRLLPISLGQVCSSSSLLFYFWGRIRAQLMQRNTLCRFNGI